MRRKPPAPRPHISNSRNAKSKKAGSARVIRMEEMTWPDVKAALEQGFTTVVVGVGSTEQHGPHLPTMTDTRLGDEVAFRVAAKLGHALQARTISVGCSAHHLAFPGTISLRPETLKMIILDYIDSLVRGGFKRIIFLPFHGGNFPTVEEAVKEARVLHPGVRVIGVTDLRKLFGFLSSVSAEFGITPEESGGHAGENETSMMLFVEKDLVVRDRFAPGYVGATGDREREIMHEQGMHALSKNGVVGDPAKASPDKGEVYLDRLADFMLQEIKSQS